VELGRITSGNGAATAANNPDQAFRYGWSASKEAGSMKPHASPADFHHAQGVEPEDSQAKQIFEQLGYHHEGLPVDAIRAATANRAAMMPLILRALDQPAATSGSMQNALFIALHLLGF
jgi:hypothetical protein